MDSQHINSNGNKVTKNPNFAVVVGAAAIFLLIALAFATFFLHRDARKVDPHGPNPTPNSMLVPVSPAAPLVAG